MVDRTARTAQRSALCMGLRSTRLSPAWVLAAARLFDGSTSLGLSSALPALLSSAQLPHHGPWMANDSPRSRGCGHCATSHARAVHLERATAALRRAGRRRTAALRRAGHPHSPPMVTLVVGSAQLAHTVLAVHPASDGYLVSEKPTVEADSARSSPTWAGGRGVGAHGQQRPSRRRQRPCN